MSHHETTIITGALDLTQKMAKDAMTPIAETFCLDINSKIDMYVPTFYLLSDINIVLFYYYNSAFLYP